MTVSFHDNQVWILADEAQDALTFQINTVRRQHEEARSILAERLAREIAEWREKYFNADKTLSDARQKAAKLDQAEVAMREYEADLAELMKVKEALQNEADALRQQIGKRAKSRG